MRVRGTNRFNPAKAGLTGRLPPDWIAPCKSSRMLAPHPQHLRGFSYLGPYRYSLRYCTHDRQALFASDIAVNLVRSQVLRSFVCSLSQLIESAYLESG